MAGLGVGAPNSPFTGQAKGIGINFGAGASPSGSPLYSAGPYNTFKKWNPGGANAPDVVPGWKDVQRPDDRTMEQKALDEISVEQARENLYQSRSGGTSGTRVSSSGGSGGTGGMTTQELLSLINSFKNDKPAEPVVPSPTAPPRVADPVAPKLDQGAYFARAKDATGQVANKALEALRDEMTTRGVQGSGIEGNLTKDILKGAAQTQAQAAFDAAQQQWAADWDAAKTGYMGQVDQRANDIGLTGTGFGGQVTQRGQTMDYGQQLMRMLPSFLSVLR